ncbi:hypothetical protein HDU67_005893 [Dinochytrium kinnereticum]|nr:hypothetical protein HDU67_005893 [Dinochytrium kinnereticum]
MPPKKAKGKKKAPRSDSALSSSSVPQASQEYTFNGKRGDEAYKAFEEAAATIRETLKQKEENSFVVLRVRQVDFEYHDFLITLPKSATIYRLQTEIANQQHGAAVFPADVVVYKSLPISEDPNGSNDTSKGSDPVPETETDQTTGSVLCQDPYAKLTDVFPDVESFSMSDSSQTPTNQGLKPSNGPLTTEDGIVIQPRSAITFVHDLPNLTPQAPQASTMGMSAGILKRPPVNPLLNSRDKSNTDSSPSPLIGGRYVSVYYDILPYISPPITTLLQSRRGTTKQEGSRTSQLARVYAASVIGRNMISSRIDSLPYPDHSRISSGGYLVPPIIGGLDRSCPVLMLEKERSSGGVTPFRKFQLGGAPERGGEAMKDKKVGTEGWGSRRPSIPLKIGR